MKKLIKIIPFVIIILFIVSNSYPAPRNVLLEYCTGTWCQFCPCGESTAEALLNSHPNMVVIAYHGLNNDPFDFYYGWEIRSFLNFTSYPTAIIDRTNTPGNPSVTYNMWTDRVQNRYTNFSNADVNLVITDKSYNPVTRMHTLKVTATPAITLYGIYMINFVFTEDNVIYPQTGNSTCPGSSNFNHKWIARSMINEPYGDTLIKNVWNQNQTLTKTITAKVDTGWVATNCKINVFVRRDSSTLSLGNVMQAVKSNVTGSMGISNQNTLPEKYELQQNYPNPFNPKTNIKFSLPEDGNVDFSIYDLKGSLVSTYFSGFLKAGNYNVDFNGYNLSSGIYFYRLVSKGKKDFSETKKMMLVK